MSPEQSIKYENLHFLGVILYVRVSLEQEEEYNIYIAQFSLQSLFNNNTILFANGTKIPQQ